MLPTVGGEPVPARAAAPPAISVAAPAWMYPAFDPAVSRYAVHRSSDGTVRVQVTGDGAVSFDGVPDDDGNADFADAQPGDEISVFVDDGNLRRAYALHVLPDSFPRLAATHDGTPLQPGNIAVTIDRFDGVSPRYEAVLDRHGVPVHAREHGERVLDLKLARSGQLTVQRPTTTGGRTGEALVVLDDRFREVRRFDTTGLVNTDGHDSVLEADGSRWLMAYEPNTSTGLVDSVIQHVLADGTVDFQWSSAPYADETTAAGNADYAHLNSIDVQPNGDVLASFRHLSSVFLIASRAHDGHQPGDVIWKLGGRDSSFTFPSGDVGPCAQHSASLLGNGHVLLFDNGSTPFFGNLCVDPADQQGPATQRLSTRVVELALDGDRATVARTYGEADRFSWFMGSAARLPGGHVLIGWSADTHAISTETDATGATLWSLADTRWRAGGPEPSAYVSYRAALVPERDGFDPEVTLDGPPDGAVVQEDAVVPVEFSCQDRGGSTLQTCDGPAGRVLDTTTAGAHTWQVTARDGSGRSTTATRSFTVSAAATPTPATPTPSPTPTTTPTATPTAAPPPPGPVAPPVRRARPDLAVSTGRGSWVGAGELAPTRQTAVVDLAKHGSTPSVRIRLTNAGTACGRFVLRGPARADGGGIVMSYRSRGADRTRALSRGWRTPALDPGQSLRIRMRIRLPTFFDGRAALPLRASSDGGRDRVRVTFGR
ncbi:hypothetical protein C7S10_20665 [Nocardioides currus]|uniref:Uncharacterized protein n=1 Tax=Nocardioides currus TaxID=2133958 RepID=A0A2R7YS78_9ACTN|nr:hypothetical protein C7S10_20665 [Nocardioides currus]